MTITIPPALRHKRYRYLWLGLIISVAGTRMQVAALFWHINTLTDSPLALGMVGAVRVVPIILFSLLGGMAADIFNRRKLMLFTTLWAATVAMIFGLLTLSGRAELWHLYTLTAIQALALSFDLPARQSLVPNLVPSKDLPSAFSLNSIAFQTGSILGPALGGFTIAALGLEYAYIFNALSYLAVILALILMGNVEQEGHRTGRPELSWLAVKEGLRFTFGHPIILSSMLLDFIATFFARIDTLMPIFARQVLGIGAVSYGWLSAAQSIGAGAAALVLSQKQNIKRQGKVLLVAVVIFGISTLIFGLSRSFWLSMLALIAVGASDSISAIIRNTIRQLQTKDHLRGRVTSINQIFFIGGPQLGEIEAGVVGQLFGAPMAAISGGIACILGVGWIARKFPGLRNYQGDEHAKV